MESGAGATYSRTAPSCLASFPGPHLYCLLRKKPALRPACQHTRSPMHGSDAWLQRPPPIRRCARHSLPLPLPPAAAASPPSSNVVFLARRGALASRPSYSYSTPACRAPAVGGGRYVCSAGAAARRARRAGGSRNERASASPSTPRSRPPLLPPAPRLPALRFFRQPALCQPPSAPPASRPPSPSHPPSRPRPPAPLQSWPAAAGPCGLRALRAAPPPPASAPCSAAPPLSCARASAPQGGARRGRARSAASERCSSAAARLGRPPCRPLQPTAPRASAPAPRLSRPSRGPSRGPGREPRASGRRRAPPSSMECKTTPTEKTTAVREHTREGLG